MSHIQGLRNLKDLYSSRYNDYPNNQDMVNGNSSAPQSAANSSRIKLPVFSSNSQNQYNQNVAPKKVYIQFNDNSNISPNISKLNPSSALVDAPSGAQNVPQSPLVQKEIYNNSNIMHINNNFNNHVIGSIQSNNANNNINLNNYLNDQSFVGSSNGGGERGGNNLMNNTNIGNFHSNSFHHSPSPSPNNLSNSQYMTTRSSKRDYSNSIGVSGVGNNISNANHPQSARQTHSNSIREKEIVIPSFKNSINFKQAINAPAPPSYNQLNSTGFPVHQNVLMGSTISGNQHNILNEKNSILSNSIQKENSFYNGSISNSNNPPSLQNSIHYNNNNGVSSNNNGVSSSNGFSLYDQQKNNESSIPQVIRIDRKVSISRDHSPYGEGSGRVTPIKQIPFNNMFLNFDTAIKASSRSGVESSRNGAHESHRQSNNDSRNQSRNERSDVSPGRMVPYHQEVSQNMFSFHYVIGKGGFGKVWKVEMKKSQKLYAMKEIIITKRSVNSVMSERQLLSELQHPFLVNMNMAFQDRDNLYLAMDLLTGGDLRFHIGKQKRFKEVQTTCMMLALQYLHNRNIIHRDIKPENLVLEQDGYVRVTDLGIARYWKPENAQDTSGTPGYMAPEVMCRQNHGIAVDYFAVGVIGYEFMMGRRPYLGRSRKEIRDQILAQQVQIRKHQIPEGWSIEAADFINRMIQRQPVNRLGINGPEQVKTHPWLKNFPWNQLYKRELEAPYVPQSIDDNPDYRQQISLDGKDSNEDLIQQNALLLRRNSVQNLFSGYNFDPAVNQINNPSPFGGGGTGSTAATHQYSNTNTDRSFSAMQ